MNVNYYFVYCFKPQIWDWAEAWSNMTLNTLYR